MAKIYSKWFKDGDYISLFDEEHNLISNKEFSCAQEYSDGILVKESGKKGMFYYVDNYGRFSQPFYEASLPIKGYSIVQATAKSNPQIRDNQGNLSEEYVDLRQCSDGSIISQKDYGNGKRIHEPNKGTISQEFDYISPESFAGIRIVSNNHRHSYRIRYSDGSLSATTYKEMSPFDINGFARAENKGDGKKIIYVDLLGRESEDYTQSGADFAQFLLGNIGIEDMDPSDFSDESFCNEIRKLFAKQYKSIVDDSFNRGEKVDLATVKSWMAEVESNIEAKKQELDKTTCDKNSIENYLENYV